MIELETKIKLDKQTITSPNLSGLFSESDLDKLGLWVWEGYDRDRQSRTDWEKRNEAGMDLAMQLQKDKSFPWPNCSNVAFPLITIATMQFHARAYAGLLEGPDIVQYRVAGDDPEGQEAARAIRVGRHMSYQLLEEDAAWEEQHDRLLLNLGVVGTAFKKSYYSAMLGHNVSELVMARDLVVNYWAKSLDDCPRLTHIIPLFRNDFHERIMRGTFRDVREEGWFRQLPPTETTQSADKRRGQVPEARGDENTPFMALEQHCLIDLDGDGYAEPYIITIERSSKAVLRIVVGFDRPEDIERNVRGEIIAIRRQRYFTKYSFIPSPDGGIYDIGFGVFLGPLNEAVSTMINQLIDAGTLSTMAGGFLAKGAKIHGGTHTFDPFSWNRVQVAGDDLRKSIFSLPVREPSATLFQLLVLLIEYTNRISGATEMIVGESPGQNTPAETSRTVLEQGLKIYNSIFKRVWRSMKQEFKLLYTLNAVYMPEKIAFGAGREQVTRADYLGNPSRIVPSADPNVISDQARLQQAITIKQSAMSTPGYNIDAVERNLLRALKVDGIEVLFPGADKLPPAGPSEKVQLESLKQETKRMELQLREAQFAAELMETARVNSAKIANLEAQAVKLLAEAESEDTGQQIAALQTIIGAAKQQNEYVMKQIELVMKGLERADDAKSGAGGGVASRPGHGSPVLRIAPMEGGFPAAMGGGGIP